MTATQELEAFAAAITPFCQEHNLQFFCLQGERDLPLASRSSSRPHLFLSQVAEELVCGHLALTAEGQTLFIRVRTPFSASSSLKFVTLRSYSLTLIQDRGGGSSCFERNFSPGALGPDFWQLLNQATSVVLQAQLVGHLFLQLDQLAPHDSWKNQMIALRATFCSGTLAGTVLPPAA